jgi:hypothetical protein
VYPVSARFLDALRQSHNVRVQVDAYRAGVLVASDLPVVDGSVGVDATSDVRRQLDLAIADPTLAPKAGDTTGPLTPFGTELFVRRGIAFPDGSVEWVPLGWFRVQSVNASLGTESVHVAGVDRSRRVADAKFLAPTQSVTANTIPNEIKRLVQGAIPGQPFSILTPEDTSTPDLIWEQERWAAISDLATAIGAECFFDADGTCILRPVASIDSDVSWYVDAGQTGVLIDGAQETSRESTYNGVVATGERTDDTAPITATVTDTNPSSPTYWSGPYGQVPYFYESASITTLTQAQTAAAGLLARTKGLTRQVALTSVPNPALDAGDVIQVVFPDATFERHIVDSLTIPLTPGESMPIGTRSTDPTKE